MKSGELAARLRANDAAIKQHKAFTREWKDAVAIQRSALFTNLPLILAALDVAEWASNHDVLAPHVTDCSVYEPRKWRALKGEPECDCGLYDKLRALRRAEED